MKPICFLDVDGVINVFDGADDWNEHLYEKSLTFPNPRNQRWTHRDVILDRRHPAQLALIAADFEIVWATAWEDAANPALAELLGLPPLPVVNFDLTRATSGLHWKTRRLADWAAGRPFVWIDDQCTPRDASWLHAANPSTLLLYCDPMHGLGDRHVLAALDFAANLAGSKT